MPNTLDGTNQTDVDEMMRGLGSGTQPEPAASPPVPAPAPPQTSYPNYDKVTNNPTFQAFSPRDKRLIMERWVKGGPGFQDLDPQSQMTVINRAQSKFQDDAGPTDTALSAEQVKQQFDIPAKKYVYGGEPSSNRSDCSGFTCDLYKRNGVPNLPRTAQEQFAAKNGAVIPDKAALQPGDQVFFTGTNGHTDGTASHTGFYLGVDANGNRVFTHNSSTKGGVTISNIDTYPLQFIGAKRYPQIDQVVKARGQGVAAPAQPTLNQASGAVVGSAIGGLEGQVAGQQATPPQPLTNPLANANPVTQFMQAQPTTKQSDIDLAAIHDYRQKYLQPGDKSDPATMARILATLPDAERLTTKVAIPTRGGNRMVGLADLSSDTARQAVLLRAHELSQEAKGEPQMYGPQTNQPDPNVLMNVLQKAGMAVNMAAAPVKLAQYETTKALRPYAPGTDVQLPGDVAEQQRLAAMSPVQRMAALAQQPLRNLGKPESETYAQQRETNEGVIQKGLSHVGGALSEMAANPVTYAAGGLGAVSEAARVAGMTRLASAIRGGEIAANTGFTVQQLAQAVQSIPNAAKDPVGFLFDTGMAALGGFGLVHALKSSGYKPGAPLPDTVDYADRTFTLQKDASGKPAMSNGKPVYRVSNPKEVGGAVQEPQAGGVLQRQPQEVGGPGSQRGGVEQGVQGPQVTGEGQGVPETQGQAAPHEPQGYAIIGNDKSYDAWLDTFIGNIEEARRNPSAANALERSLKTGQGQNLQSDSDTGRSHVGTSVDYADSSGAQAGELGARSSQESRYSRQQAGQLGGATELSARTPALGGTRPGSAISEATASQIASISSSGKMVSQIRTLLEMHDYAAAAQSARALRRLLRISASREDALRVAAELRNLYDKNRVQTQDLGANKTILSAQPQRLDLAATPEAQRLSAGLQEHFGIGSEEADIHMTAILAQAKSIGALGGDAREYLKSVGVQGAPDVVSETPPQPLNAPGAEGVQAGAKEPWMMTRGEYTLIHPETTRAQAESQPGESSSHYISGRFQKAFRIAEGEHRMAVEKAISEGKPVPQEVLADYPDLAKNPDTLHQSPEPAPPRQRYRILSPDRESEVTVTDSPEMVEVFRKEGYHVVPVQADEVQAKASQPEGPGRLLQQEEQTRTPEFKRWFGESKVTDKLGAPVVVYHGSPDARFVQDDGTFKSNSERLGVSKNDPNRAFFFSESHKTASTYADPYRAFDYQNSEPGVVPVYLSLKNPMVIDHEGQNWKGTRDAVERAKAAGYDGLIVKNVVDDYNTAKNSKPTTVYAAFDPQQIKSATGNTGEFSPDNPNIFHQNEQAGPKGEPKASVEFPVPGQRIVRALTNPDASSIPHEFMHVFHDELINLAQTSEKAKGLLDIAAEWTGADKNGWGVKEREDLARGYERYLREGKAPSEGLKAVFEKYREWLVNIYRAIKGSSLDVKMTPEIRAFFDRSLTEGDRAEEVPARELGAESAQTGVSAKATAPTAPETAAHPFEETSARKASFARDLQELADRNPHVKDMVTSLPDAERKPWQVSMDEAIKKGYHTEEHVRTTIDEIRKKSRALDDEETAGMVLRGQEIKNRLDALDKEAADAKNEQGVLRAGAERESLLREFAGIAEVSKKSGTEKGRALASQKLTVNDKMDLTRVVGRAAMAKGKPLTTDETESLRTKVNDYAARNAEYEKALAESKAHGADLESRIADLEAKAAVNRIAKDTARETRTRTSKRTDLKSLAAELGRGRRTLHQETEPNVLYQYGEIDPEDKSILQEMAKAVVGEGEKDANKIVARVQAEAEPYLNGIEDREVRDAISGYGVKAEGTTDPVELQLQQAKRAMRLISQLEDVKAGQKPEASGFKPKPDEPNVAVLRAELHEALKAAGMREPWLMSTEQRQTAKLTRLEASITEVERRIKENDYSGPSKVPGVPPTPSIEKAQAALDKLREEYKKATPQDVLDARRLKAAKEAVRRNLAEWERKLSERDFKKKERPEGPTDDELAALRNKRDAVKDEVNAQILMMQPISFMQKVNAIRRAGLITAPRVIAKVLVSHGIYLGIDELAKYPASVIDAAVSLKTGQRGLYAPKVTEIAKTALKAATQGMQEAAAIARYGETEAQKRTGMQPIGATGKSLHMTPQTGTKIGDAYVEMAGRAHSAAYRPFKLAAFEKARMELRRVYPDLDPEAIDAEAAVSAEAAVFLNKNKLSSAVRAFTASMRAKGKTGVEALPGHIAANTLDWLFPVQTVPVNLVGRMLEYTPAGMGYETAKAVARRAVNEKMTVAEQRQFSQTFGRGLTGLGIMALGAWLRNNGMMSGIPGEKTEDWKEREDLKKRGWGAPAIKIGNRSYEVSPINPIGMIMAIGASIGHAGPGQIASASLRELPYLGFAGELEDLKTARGGTYIAGSNLGSLVPTWMADIAAQGDERERRRQSAIDYVTARVPGLRQSLEAKETPETNKLYDPFNSRVVSGSPVIEHMTKEERAAARPVTPESIRREARKSLPKRPTAASLLR